MRAGGCIDYDWRRGGSLLMLLNWGEAGGGGGGQGQVNKTLDFTCKIFASSYQPQATFVLYFY